MFCAKSGSYWYIEADILDALNENDHESGKLGEVGRRVSGLAGEAAMATVNYKLVTDKMAEPFCGSLEPALNKQSIIRCIRLR